LECVKYTKNEWYVKKNWPEDMGVSPHTFKRQRAKYKDSNDYQIMHTWSESWIVDFRKEFPLLQNLSDLAAGLTLSQIFHRASSLMPMITV